MEKRIPPYFYNFDDTHCYQCALRGALEYFNPSRQWTWEELEDLTGKKTDLYTWSFKTCADLPELGYEIVQISDLSTRDFAANPEKTIREFFSEEGAEEQIRMSDLQAEKSFAEKMLKNQSGITIYQRSFTEQDIVSLLNDGYFIIPQINPYKLDDQKGYAGHAILIYTHENGEAIYHDSDSEQEGISKRRPLSKIVEAALDNGKMEGLIAIRPKNS